MHGHHIFLRRLVSIVPKTLLRILNFGWIATFSSVNQREQFCVFILDDLSHGLVHKIFGLVFRSIFLSIWSLPAITQRVWSFLPRHLLPRRFIRRWNDDLIRVRIIILTSRAIALLSDDKIIDDISLFLFTWGLLSKLRSHIVLIVHWMANLSLISNLNVKVLSDILIFIIGYLLVLPLYTDIRIVIIVNIFNIVCNCCIIVIIGVVLVLSEIAILPLHMPWPIVHVHDNAWRIGVWLWGLTRVFSFLNFKRVFGWTFRNELILDKLALLGQSSFTLDLP